MGLVSTELNKFRKGYERLGKFDANYDDWQ